MGCVDGIKHNKFPKQGEIGRTVKVMFNYSDPKIDGVVVRDDLEYPHIGIIRLSDGRHVLTTECQYSFCHNGFISA